MKLQPFLAAAAVAALAVSLTACSSTSDPPADNPASTGATTSGGGTLRIVGTDDLDHLDPTMVGLVMTNNTSRVLSRQLISYAASTDPTGAGAEPKADLAADLPDVSDDGLTYTFELRDGITWDAPDGPRDIVANDFANGIERICNPLGTAFTSSYFSVIEGFNDFCDGYDTENPSIEDIKQHITEDSIAGIATPDDKTIVFSLTEEASDFIYMVSLANASPTPAEALEYAPDSPAYRANYVSSGPYTVEEYSPDKHLYLIRNPAWNADSDPLRAANVDRIEITFGVTPDAAIQQIQSNDADATLGINVTAAQLSQLKASGDTKVTTFGTGATFFLWINSISENNNGALKRVEARQALQYAVDKSAFVQQLGGPEMAKPAIGIFGSGVIGYSTTDPYATPNNAGDPEKTKALLAEAGIPALTLKLAYRSDNAVEPGIAQTIQENMAKAGVTVELVPIPGSDFYPNFMMQHENGQEGKWDLALCGWSPDWAGGAARSVFQPQFTFDGLTDQGYNYTDYNNQAANDLMKQALSADSTADAAKFWAQVTDTVMVDAPVLPLYEKTVARYVSESVQSGGVFVLGEAEDWTNLTLKS
jgi:peptide/nickel transport system substrate-binding protein